LFDQVELTKVVDYDKSHVDGSLHVSDTDGTFITFLLLCTILSIKIDLVQLATVWRTTVE
jgi:hypothetical protein